MCKNSRDDGGVPASGSHLDVQHAQQLLCAPLPGCHVAAGIICALQVGRQGQRDPAGLVSWGQQAGICQSQGMQSLSKSIAESDMCMS